jgi:metal-responsive CopG/Arc/MetJ family transcriptional regulator
LCPLKYVFLTVTDKPKVLLILDEDLLKRIDDYRYEKRIPPRNEAIRRLLDEALKKYEKKTKNRNFFYGIY